MFTIRSDSIRGNATRWMMIRFGMIGMLLMSVSAVQVSAQADTPSFAIFEHRPTPVEPEAVEPALPAHGETNLSLSKAAFAPSFQEVIYLANVREAELRYGLPTGLLQALIWTESRFNPMAISPAGAAGLAQLMPGTARYLGITNRHDPVASIDGGARYLREMLDKFGQIHLALAAYNAGPGAVSRAGGIPRNSETPGYVRSVLERWQAIGSRI
jgi:soluble lytic murein transglycosylase-like protein